MDLCVSSCGDWLSGGFPEFVRKSYQPLWQLFQTCAKTMVLGTLSVSKIHCGKTCGRVSQEMCFSKCDRRQSKSSLACNVSWQSSQLGLFKNRVPPKLAISFLILVII